MSTALKKVADGWMNLITGIGTLAKSRAAGIDFQQRREYTADELRRLYDGDALAYRVCTEPAKDMFRRGIQVAIENNEDLSDTLTDRLQVLEAPTVFADAIGFHRCTGQSAILMMVDDGRDIAQPINETGIRAVRWIRAFDRREVTIERLDTDPLSPTFGQPSLYKLETQQDDGTVSTVFVHPDRIIWFGPHKKANSTDFVVSVLSRSYDSVRDWGYAWASVVEMIDQAAVGLWKIGHLRQLIGKEGESILETRFGIASLGKSVARAMVVDRDHEDFEWRQLALGGLPETIDRIEKRVSAATGIPLVRLFGESPAGLNATGESDIRMYYDNVEAERTQHVIPKVERLVKLLFAEAEGVNTGEPPVWQVEFPPLWSPTESEQRTQELQAAQMLVGLTNGGIILDEEARSAFGPNGIIRSIELDDGLYEEWLATKPEFPAESEEEEEDPEGEGAEGPEQ